MRIGLALPHYDFSFPDGGPVTIERVVRYARAAEAGGFDMGWVSDHLFLDLTKYGGPSRRYRTPEALSLLAVLAERTERLALGSLVLCAPFRAAAVTAAAAATLYSASGGRFELGLGAGWYEDEFAAAGIPFRTAGDRLEALESYTGDVRAALDAGAGPATRSETWTPPRRDRPPVWIGGKGGPRIMGIVAGQADGWNICWSTTPDDYAAKLTVLRDACAATGRDPASVRLSVGLLCLLGSDEADLARRWEGLQRWTPGGAFDRASLEGFAGAFLAGTPQQCASRIKEFAALGVEQIILSVASLPFAVHDDEQLDLAAELIALVR